MLLWRCVVVVVVVVAEVVEWLIILKELLLLEAVCYVHTTLRTNWHVCPPTPRRDSRVRPAPRQPVTDTGAPKNPVPDHASQTRQARKKDVQISKCELRRARQQPEASTGHTSPFKPNGERTLKDTIPPQRRKCVKYVRSHQQTVAEHVSTVEPSIAPTEIVISSKNQFSVLLSNTQTPGTKTARYKDNGKNHQIPSANCASIWDRKFFQKRTWADA